MSIAPGLQAKGEWMRVLHVHNFYQLPGGEDQCFATTGAMLENYGHEVIRFTLHNDIIADIGKAGGGEARPCGTAPCTRSCVG